MSSSRLQVIIVANKDREATFNLSGGYDSRTPPPTTSTLPIATDTTTGRTNSDDDESICSNQDLSLCNADKPSEYLVQHSMEETAVQCSLCSNEVVVFMKWADFLKHICVDHLQEDRLIDLPEARL